MEFLLNTLAEHHGFASAAQLNRAGVQANTLRRAVADGLVVRVRRGWFALPGVDEFETIAVAHGGVLTCVSALKKAGLWVVEAKGVHIAIQRRSGDVRSHGVVRVHWARWPGCEPASNSVDGIASALLHMIMCIDPSDAIVTLDSAVNTGAIGFDDLMALGSLLPATRRWILDKVDPKCQSGLESRVRLAFTRRGLQVRTQVFISGVGHVDVVIGDRMVVETDGRTYHSTQEQLDEDYRRDLELFDQDYERVRIDRKQVMNTWEHTQSVIERAIERGAHLRRGRRRSK
ncbi:type IV toxin-antitoxin system AbiEi family antitoxin domain-containing protein [Microbacteriaceae bacterium VKM Ac-2854]|nr:type IV toxin-antitoxin system AbiEi family antitoxin domain-containing protein [Microbacteriaceae bacterium VKM Ac-2854]